MTIIVTGGAGFIGSNFILYMLRRYKDCRIVCLDKLTYAGNLSALDDVMNNPNFRFVKGDICDRELVYNLLNEEKPNSVINFAAETHVDRSIQNSDVFLQTNVIGVGVLLDACKDLGKIRFHQISTDEVYGDLPYDTDLAFDEKSPLMPSSPYSASKAAADLLVLSYYKTFGLPVTISRCTNNFGAHQFPEKLIPLMIKNALEDKSLPVYGNGENVRDWIFVDDHCSAVDTIIRNGKIGEIYNIGSHNEIKNIDLVERLCDILNKPKSLITYVEDRKGHDRRYAVNYSKISCELGWTPETSFDDGILKTVRWYQDYFTKKI